MKIKYTDPILPDVQQLAARLQKSWETGIVTNNGPLLKDLEQKLAEKLSVPNVVLCANGTLALLNALLASVSEPGEVITTPFTFAATTHAIISAGHKVVFADIDPETMNLCPDKVRKKINKRTVAILPVHSYGNLCNIAEFKSLEQHHGIPVIYDASHCFGISDSFGSVLRHGKVSTLSLHATKAFNSIEGGAIITHDDSIAERARLLVNFGVNEDKQIIFSGLNSKMSELHAAVGLLNLDTVEQYNERRKQLFYRYLNGFIGSGIETKLITENVKHNFSYVPIMCRKRTAAEIDTLLRSNGVESKRYFFPLTLTASFFTGSPRADVDFPEAVKAVNKVVCLPAGHRMSFDDVDFIVDILCQ